MIKKESFYLCVIITSCLFSACKSNSTSSDSSHLKDAMEGADAKLAEQAVSAAAGKGEEILPQLREWAESTDPRLRLRAHTAIGRITGQWGSQTDLVWNTSFQKAVEKAKAARESDPEKIGKPIMLLQLFGKLNEEFC